MADEHSPTIRPTSSMSSLGRSGTYSSQEISPAPGRFFGRGERPEPGNLGRSAIQSTIQHLQNEQERVQKKTFTNWMNTYLRQKSPPMQVENVFEEIKDGVVLLSLLEVLTGEKLPIEQGKLKRIHHVSNLSTALSFLESKKIKLVNINVSDIADGKHSIVLGLIWTIILYFQIENTLSQAQHSSEPQKLSPLEKLRKNTKKALLAWTENAITKCYGIEIKDFGKSWRDGLAFNAIVHTIQPELVDMDAIRHQNAKVNLEHAFSMANQHLGIPRLLDPEDVDVEKPDEKSIMTYVAQFLKAYPDAALAKRIRNPADQELAEYNDLLTWLNEEAEEVLQSVDQSVTERQHEYMDYLAFKTELDRQELTYKKLADKVAASKCVKLTRDQWLLLNRRWKDVYAKTQKWLWKLDTSLSGGLGKFGDWLFYAEELLAEELQMIENHGEMAAQIGFYLQRHLAYFKDLESNRQFFLQLKQSGHYDDAVLAGPQTDNMANRLQHVCHTVPIREKKLAFEEEKYILLSYLVASEIRLHAWTVKYGRLNDVEAMLEDYQEFVVHGQLFENYDKTFQDVKHKAEQYRQAGNKEVGVAVDEYLNDVTSRWKKVSVEIKSMKSMLEEVITTWKHYSTCLDLLNIWLTEGKQVMRRSTEEKELFFRELAEYEKKHKASNDAANFLIEICEKAIAAEIKQTILLLNHQFSELFEQYQSFQQVEVVKKSTEQYNVGFDRVLQWLKNVEEFLTQKIPCVHNTLNEYLQELDTYGVDIVDIVTEFKTTTKIVQSLVKATSYDNVNDMLRSVHVQKEIIVRLRKEIPEKIEHIKSILPNIDSLETGIPDICQWLDEGEALLSTHKLDGTTEQTEERLERHKAFFSELAYQKSILESKNKVYQKLGTFKTKLKNVNFDDIDGQMDALNKRFQMCINVAKDWEKKLDNLSGMWQALHQHHHILEEWLEQAWGIIEDREDDLESLIRKHKMFFNHVDLRLEADFVCAAKDILMVLEEADRVSLTGLMEKIQSTWKNTNYVAPIHVMKLEFSVPEEKFLGYMDTAEKNLQQQQQQLAREENVKETLLRHVQMFHDSQFKPACTKYLEIMQSFAVKLFKYDKDETIIQEAYKEYEERWQRLLHAIDQLYLDLKQLPERWKEYHQKLTDFNTFVLSVEGLLNNLKKEDLTSEEYKELLTKFQKIMKNMNKHNEVTAWLVSDLDDLLKDSPDADMRKEKERLEELMTRFHGLQPVMDKTSKASSVFAKCYDYRDGIDKRTNWLDDAQKHVMEQSYINGLDDAKAYLDEHEKIVMKLDSEQTNIKAEIEAGKCLQQGQNAPVFVSRTIQNIDSKWKDTNQLAKAKHDKLKIVVSDWESYEKEKSHVLQCLKKAEAELEKPLATTGQDVAKKDLQSKKELKNTLNRLKSSLSEMEKLNTLLCDGASREQQGPLKGEMTDIDKHLDNISQRLNAKLSDLEGTIAKWIEYYKRLNNFCDWLNEKENNLSDVCDVKQDTAKEQLMKVKTIAAEVYENHITLENLEKDARGLSQNFRSHETAALKTKLTGVRRQWESLCNRAKDQSSALKGSVAHWQMYQNLSQQLMPWVVKAENYCSTKIPKCTSLNEAKEFHELHQSFLRECEEQFPVIEKLNAETSHLLEQPEVVCNMEALQHRWSSILGASEDHSHRIDKSYGAWVAHDQEMATFEEVLEKLQSRIAVEPNVNSTNVEVLEHELAVLNALQQDIHSHQPQLHALQYQYEQVKPHATSQGAEDLLIRQNKIKATWEVVTSSTTDRQGQLTTALRHRQNFYSQLQDFEKWVKKTQQKLDTGSEIYSDEVADTQNKLKAMKTESQQREAAFALLDQECKELMKNCGEDEAAILSDRYNHLLQSYTKIEDLMRNREDVCQRWTVYRMAHKDFHKKLKALEGKLATPNVEEEEVAEINAETDNLRKGMSVWCNRARDLDKLMADSQTAIKDRASQRTLHFHSELQSINSMCDTVSLAVQQKEEHLGKLQKLCIGFEAKKDGFVDILNAIVQRIEACDAGDSSLQRVKFVVQEIEEIRDDVFTHNSEYEQLRDLGRQIVQTDYRRNMSIQGQLGEVGGTWETIQTLLTEKQQLYSSIASRWQQYNDAKHGVVRILDDLDPLVQQDITVTNQPDLKKSLHQRKNAEFELHTNQAHLDQMNNKGLQLLKELKTDPSFDVALLEQDMEQVNNKWKTSNATVEQHIENLEAQLVCWEQIMLGKEDVEFWVNTMVTRLDDSLKHFDDAVCVESCLNKFKGESHHFSELMDDVSSKIRDLQKLNKDCQVPVLLHTQEAIMTQFQQATILAGKLENMMADFSGERHGLLQAIECETAWLNHVKDQLAKCDDMSGKDKELVERLKTCKVLQKEMIPHNKEIADLPEKTNVLQTKYPSAETSSLAKDVVVLLKKLESVGHRADKIEDMLQKALDQHCQDAQQIQRRWLNTAREKVMWCSDVAGDRCSLEAKLATIKDLLDSLEEGEQQIAFVSSKVDLVKPVLVHQKQMELDEQKQQTIEGWAALVEQMQQTKIKLENSVDHWTKYDNRYKAMSQWLKEVECKVRNEASLKPDLQSKSQQADFFKEIGDDIQGHATEFEDLHQSAQDISKATGDQRTVAYAAQLLTQFHTLVATTKEHVAQSKQNVGDHKAYLNKHGSCMDWLTDSQTELAECGVIADEESLEHKLQTIKALLASKKQGMAMFNTALACGEKLYLNTSNEGCEGIRRELRLLRDTWETFNDGLNETHRHLESNRMQWLSFDDNYEQLINWISDCESQSLKNIELKNTLQEKKSMMLHYRTCCQDIFSHQMMIDSVCEKGHALSFPSPQVISRLTEINTKYSILCTAGQLQVKTSEEHVDQHELYHDAYQHCKDYIAATEDKLLVCTEITGDRQVIQNRLERVQDLLNSVIEGKAKIKSAHVQGEKTVSQTAPQGQAIVRQELDGLQQHWEGLLVKMEEIQQKLSHVKQSLDAHDGSCDMLNNQLRDVEAQIKDIESTSTLKEKLMQVDKLEALQQEVHHMQGDFDDLQNTRAQIQGADTQLINYSTQLNTRYETVKNNIEEVTGQWKDYVTEHQQYEANCCRCVEWISTLQQRLQVCRDMAGDKQDVEDRLLKLQELQVETDEGSNEIHNTVETGEKLYPNMSAEGRDIIRQELRSLQDHWNQVCGQLSETGHNLNSSLLQWSSYDENFEQFQKWLLDMEVELKKHVHPKAALPEKRAELQNHRIVHQDVLSCQHAIKNLNDKAHALTQLMPLAKMNKFVGELNQKYEQVCHISKEMLEHYELAVKEHQRYQDAYQETRDWLNMSCDKLEACADTAGDKLALQNKLDRLKEFAGTVEEGNQKLGLTRGCSDKCGKHTSVEGCDVLQRELDYLMTEWGDYLSRIETADQDIKDALMLWGDFESKFGACAGWLKEIEQQIKSYELKATLQEKQTQVDNFKRQRKEILSYQPQIDSFTDNAQNLMHTTSDVRLCTQVTQLTNRYRTVLSLVKDLIGKWEKYVQDHQAYENRLEEFNSWLFASNEKLEHYQQPASGQDTMQDRCVVIQILISEKEHGLQKLNFTIEAGEKLFPDTASSGRDQIHQQLCTAKEDWDRLFSNLSDTQRTVDSFLLQWSSYFDSQGQVLQWVTETEAALRSDIDPKNTLQEKWKQLLNLKTIYQDIISHQRSVESVIEKAQTVLQNMSNSEVAEFITDVGFRYENLNTIAKNVIDQSEENVQDHQHYQDASQVALDWMTLMKERLSMYTETSGDRHALQNKLDRVQDLFSALEEGSIKVTYCEKSADKTEDSTAMKGRQTIQQEVDMLKHDWKDYELKLNSLKANLEHTIKQWTSFEQLCEKLSDWIKEMEKKLKDFPLKSSLEDKEEQLKRCQELMQEIKSQQRAVDEFSDNAQTLQQITGEACVGTSKSRLISRYQSLQDFIKEIMKQSEQNVADQKYYEEKLADCNQWLTKAKNHFSESCDTMGSENELQDRLEKIQGLSNERDAGIAKLSKVVEAGEKLLPNTASEGREVVQQELQQVKFTWEGLFDDLSSAQRKLEVALVQWTTFDDSCGQVENWLSDMELLLEGQLTERSTLEEKKIQLQSFMVTHQDVQSYQRLIESVRDKARSLAQSSTDKQLAQSVSQTDARYQKICALTEEGVHQYESFVASHQQYNDAYNNCNEWINNMCDKLSHCADVTGDKHAIQSRLDKIQDIQITKMEGEPKVKNVIALAEFVLPNTAPTGKDSIVSETQAIQSEWEIFVTAIDKTKTDLEDCMRQWTKFDEWHEKCSAWLKDLDARVHDTELKATIAEKQTHFDRLKSLQGELVSHRADFDALSDASRDLVTISTDTIVASQSSQLSTKYQSLGINLKELCRQWEQYILDHQSYAVSYGQCKTWIVDMRKNMSTMGNVSGDRKVFQERLGKLQELCAEKEEGIHMLQISLDNLQIVLPSTSVTGRDTVQREIQALQAEYDALSADLNNTRTIMESCLTQWMVYNDRVEQLTRWLSDFQKQLSLESELQNTLQDKKLQLERVKVLQLNINTQQATIDNLNEKSSTLEETSKDQNLAGQIQQVVTQYQTLVASAKELFDRCQEYVHDHQVYRDCYTDVSDCLTTAIDQLSTCKDIRGDRTFVETQLCKLQDVAQEVETGRIKLDSTLTKGETVLPETSSPGKALVRAELAMLSNDFDGFRTDVGELGNTLENQIQEWARYEEHYEQLIQWIKNMEVKMKSEAEPKAQLEDKNVQLQKQRNNHEEILNKQTSFDSLADNAQTLLQSTTDNCVTSQLTQISSRYTSLIDVSKDLMKRYEKHVQAHEQYAVTFTAAAMWLQSAHDKLSVCADMTGNKDSIQTQLEKLQEFVVVKEEGQVLIHTANTWGEKSMTNVSVKGQEIIRIELQQLQQEWDDMIAEISGTKVMLESCLLHWTDFSDSQSQVQKRLKDMEKHVTNTEVKGQLCEKKAELQRVQGLYQDVAAYCQMIECISSKAEDLVQTNATCTDTSSVVNHYHTLKDQAMELLINSEEDIAKHQTYHDLCNGFQSWLRVAKEKLASCSDTFGEKSVIVGKIERAKNLSSTIHEGIDRLAQATSSGEATLSQTSPSGQSKIHQDLQSMREEFEDFNSQLALAQSKLEMCLKCWDEFEESYREFNNWLKETELYLRADLEMRTTAEEKKIHCDQHQTYMNQVLEQQKSLDVVKKKAQALLSTNANVQTSHAITQITTRFQGVVTLSKDLVKNIEMYNKNHANYCQARTDFTEWLEDAHHRLVTIHNSAASRDDVSHKLSSIAEMQSALDQGHNCLHLLLKNAEKTQPNTNQQGCLIIQQETERAKTGYENLLTELSQTKRGLERTLSQWGDFDHTFEQLHSWVTDMESKLLSDPDLKSDLPEKKSTLEKFKALKSDVDSHRESVERLEERANQVQDVGPQMLAAELKVRFEKVADASKDIVGKLNGHVQSHQEYRASHIACLDWLANTRTRLQRLSDFSGDRQTLQDRLKQLKEYKAELKQGQDMVNDATHLGERLCSSTASCGQEVIHKELKAMRDDWTTLDASVDQSQSKLETCIGTWEELDDQQQNFILWAENMESRIKGLHENGADITRKQDLLEDGERVYEEVIKNHASLDQVREHGEAIAQHSTDPRVSNTMIQLATKYQALATSAKNMVQRLRENVHDHKSYNDAFDAAANWLTVTDECVQDCSDTADDWHVVEQRIASIKGITVGMDEGLVLVNCVCDYAEKILPNTSSEGKRLIEQQVTELTNEWEKLNLAITQCNSMLEGVEEQWNNYEECHGSLVKWLANLENSLLVEPEPKAQLLEKKTQLDKYRLILSDVENHNCLINKLVERVANLETLGENPEVSDSLSDVQSRYDRVQIKAKDIVASLQRLYEDHLAFHKAQQECEKWLLQTTLKLMSHNSLNICTMELTQRQIDRHRVLIQDIDSYRITLDTVNKIGQQLMQENPRVPHLTQQVESQLQTLEENFLNLQSTAQQIRDRLADVLQRWQDYQRLLEHIQQFLADNFPRWLSNSDAEIPDNMQDAQHKLETIEKMLEKLTGMRRDVTNALRCCENLGGSTEGAVQTDGSTASAMVQLSANVNQSLQLGTSEIEKRLDQMHSIIRQWELVDRNRVDIRAWLHSRQKEVQDLEQPAKLHEQAAKVELSKLEALRDELSAKGPAVEELVTCYSNLTQHDPLLSDPVVKAVKDDWEELSSQVSNLLEERQETLQACRDLQSRQHEIDEDLEKYARELERIEQESMADKVGHLKPSRRKCHSTQTPNASTRLNRSAQFADSDSDDDDSVFIWEKPRRGTKRSHNRNSLQKRGTSGGASPRTWTPTLKTPSHLSGRLHHGSKKSGLESESEESGYGETNYTMQASSFDTNEVFDLEARRNTPSGLEMNNFSDDDSTVSFIVGIFPPVNPDDLKDASCQTPGHARTQTRSDMFSGTHEMGTQVPHDMQTQTPHNISMQTSNVSLQSVGNQTRRSSGSRTDLLRNILIDIQSIKQQRGIDSMSSHPSEDDTISVTSGRSLKMSMLQKLSKDVQSLKDKGSHGEAATQTLTEQNTQTSQKLFPEGDTTRKIRHGILNDLVDEVRHLRGSKSTSRTPTLNGNSRSQSHSRPSSRLGFVSDMPPPSYVDDGNRASLLQIGTPKLRSQIPVQLVNIVPQHNRNAQYIFPENYVVPSRGMNAIAPANFGNYTQPVYPDGMNVTTDDLNNERAERWSNYCLPPRRIPAPPLPPQFVVPVFPPDPRTRQRSVRYLMQERDMDDGFLSDESEYEGRFSHPRRERHQHDVLECYHLDDALAEAMKVKRMSRRLKNTLYDELL